MANKPMKLHTQKNKRRLWLEEQKYGLAGFVPGSRFTVRYNSDSVEIKVRSTMVLTRCSPVSKLHQSEFQLSVVSRLSVFTILVSKNSLETQKMVSILLSTTKCRKVTLKLCHSLLELKARITARLFWGPSGPLFFHNWRPVNDVFTKYIIIF